MKLTIELDDETYAAVQYLARLPGGESGTVTYASVEALMEARQAASVAVANWCANAVADAVMVEKELGNVDDGDGTDPLVAHTIRALRGDGGI